MMESRSSEDSSRVTSEVPLIAVRLRAGFVIYLQSAIMVSAGQLFMRTMVKDALPSAPWRSLISPPFVRCARFGKTGLFNARPQLQT